VRIQPGAYRVGPETIGAQGTIDPLFPNTELEWSTNRRGVVILVGLLVKVEDMVRAETPLLGKQDVAGTATAQGNNLILTRFIFI